ncbi:hypothetical protein Tco_0459333 [Tanacetum coccineum]
MATRLLKQPLTDKELHRYPHWATFEVQTSQSSPIHPEQTLERDEAPFPSERRIKEDKGISVQILLLSQEIFEFVIPWKGKRCSSREERIKPLGVRALVMTINLNLPPKILDTRAKAIEEESIERKKLCSIDKEFETCPGGGHSVLRSEVGYHVLED